MDHPHCSGQSRLFIALVVVGILLSLVAGSFAGAMIGSGMVCRQPEEKPEPEPEPQLTIDELCQHFGLGWWTLTIPEGYQAMVADKENMLQIKVVGPGGRLSGSSGGMWSSGWTAGDKVTILLGSRDQHGKVPYSLISSGYSSRGTISVELDEKVLDSPSSIGVVQPHQEVEPGKVFYKYTCNDSGITNDAVLKEGELGILVDFAPKN